MGGGVRRGGRWVTKELRITNMISVAAEETRCPVLLHFGVCLAACSRGWAQH